MNKHQRALRAARAAKRLPIVGTAVVLLPVTRAASGFNSSNILSVSGWKDFFRNLTLEFTGFNPDGGGFNPAVATATWGPILAYVAAYKLRVAKYPNMVFKHLGLRF